MSIASLAPSTECARRVALAAAGPVVVGGLLALRLGSPAPLVALPAVVFGVTALTIPALYIATAAIGSAPAPHAIGSAVGRALAALGVTLLGVAAPLGFLLATSSSAATWLALGSLAIAAAALLGVVALHRALFVEHFVSPSRDGLFVVWAAVALGIGARLFADLALELP
jgi:hypothetical protein